MAVGGHGVSIFSLTSGQHIKTVLGSEESIEHPKMSWDSMCGPEQQETSLGLRTWIMATLDVRGRSASRSFISLIFSLVP